MNFNRLTFLSAHGSNRFRFANSNVVINSCLSKFFKLVQLGLIFHFSLFIFHFSSAQINGGNAAFKFVNLPQSARIAATGGLNLAIEDADVSFYLQNPALLNAAQNGRLHLQQNFYLVGTNQLTAALGKTVTVKNKLWGWTGAAVQYVNYGEFQQADAAGYEHEKFKAHDLMLSLGAARPITNQLNYGIAVKYMRSKYDTYTGQAFAADVGFAYSDTLSGLTASLAGKNIGTMTTNFTPGMVEPLPFDLQFGISKRLSHTPFLFCVNLHHLTRWDIRYDDPALQVTDAFASTTTTKKKSYVADKLMRHLVLGTEVYLGKVLRLNAGYNHLRRKEMAFDERRTLSGFSFGAQVALKKFGVSYAYSLYNAAVASNHISLYLNLAEFVPARKRMPVSTPNPRF